MIGSMLIGEIEQKTKIRFRNVEDFKNYFIAIDDDYDSGDVIFPGWLYGLNTPEFNKANRSQYDRGTDFKQDIVELLGNNCYNPTSGNCFLKSKNDLTGRVYTQKILTLFEVKNEDLML